MSQPKSSPKSKPKSLKRLRPSLAVIGSGRLGQALAVALASSGYRVVALVARTPSHARRAAELVGSTRKPVPAFGAGQLNDLPNSDLILISTPDDVIESVATTLAGSLASSAGSRTVLHTSGALASDVLNPLAELGLHTGSLHPLVSINEAQTGAKALRGAFYCLEGDTQALRMARLIVKDLEGKSFSIEPESKPLYHAAAVMASGHMVALFDLATKMLVSCGLKHTIARQILMPLVASAMNNLKAGNPAKALTGTFARGDLETVGRHLKALSREELSTALAVYKLLGVRSIELAEKNKINQQQLEQIKKLLL
ncbi:MAG: Rossmann-like and DUF2520 domain-containing protein [Pyrinomonadaceae bacterium]